MVLYPRVFSLSKSHVKNNRTIYFLSRKQRMELAEGKGLAYDL